MSYQQQYQLSTSEPEVFWLEQAKKLTWYSEPTQAISQNEQGLYRWFENGRLNTSFLALDHHIQEGKGDNVALIYDSPVTGVTEKFTYQKLLDEVELFAGALAAKGVIKGDRVLIYLPMIPQAAIAMLACARLGAIHSVVFGGFASHELAVRIDDAKPKVIVTASCGIEIDRVIEYKPIVDDALVEASHQVKACIVYQRPQVRAELKQGRDFDWQSVVENANPHPPVAVASTDPLYILYTSGTTGKPKGVVRDNGGHAVAMAYSMKTVYGITEDDVFWAASDVGWVVGHSYIVYGPLISGCTTVLYEGKPIKTPDAGAFWRVCEEHGVNVLFTAPTAFRAIRKEDSDATLLNSYDVSTLRRLYLAGERLDPATYQWLKSTTDLPVIDHWWQTETGWAIAGIPYGVEALAEKEGAAGVVMPGYQVEILNEHGKPVECGANGNIAIKLPLPPGTLMDIWQNTERFKAGYLSTFDGYYVTGDGGFIDNDGYLHIMGRTDDVINVAGHRLSTGEMEEVVASHNAVAECAIVGVKCPIKGQVPMAFVVMKNGFEFEHSFNSELKQVIRDKIGAIASLKHVIAVERLPKTRSGKILRKTMRQMIDGEPVQVPSTIDDPAILGELEQVFKINALVA